MSAFYKKCNRISLLKSPMKSSMISEFWKVTKGQFCFSTEGKDNGTLDYTLWTLYRPYFKSISANTELQVYSMTCCWPYNMWRQMCIKFPKNTLSEVNFNLNKRIPFTTRKAKKLKMSCLRIYIAFVTVRTSTYASRQRQKTSAQETTQLNNFLFTFFYFFCLLESVYLLI
jgi:hypothetical protein